MDMHPTLTLAVYIALGVVFLGVLTYMFLYTRGLKTKQATLNELGRLPISKDEGIAVATLEKERAGRTGTID
jgi:hypothetical protein